MRRRSLLLLLLGTGTLSAERPVPACYITVLRIGRAVCRLSARRGGSGSPFVIREESGDELWGVG